MVVWLNTVRKRRWNTSMKQHERAIVYDPRAPDCLCISYRDGIDCGRYAMKTGVPVASVADCLGDLAQVGPCDVGMLGFSTFDGLCKIHRHYNKRFYSCSSVNICTGKQDRM